MISKIFRGIKRRICNSNQTWKVKYLKSLGVKIGDGTVIYCGIENFNTEPFLVSIGENCLISNGVKFIEHDGGVNTLFNAGYFKDGRIMDAIAPIIIGNNVYIGTDAMIMPGVTIGDNVVIGARALVSKDIADNMVAVGIPAKAIENLNEYYTNLQKKNRLEPTVGMSVKEKRSYYTRKYKL